MVSAESYPVATFEGEEHFAEAGALLLEDRTIEAVVIRGVAGAALFKLGLEPDKRGDCVREALFTDAPHLAKLDEYVQKHHTQQSLSKPYNITPLMATERIITRSGGTGIHIDSPFASDIYAPAGSFEGPLTLSVRIDRNKFSRTFRLKRTHTPLISSDHAGVNEKAKNHVYQQVTTASRTNYDNLYSIDQNPGDAVLMVNYPTPTIHAVDTPNKRLTRSMVASYLLLDRTVK